MINKELLRNILYNINQNKNIWNQIHNNISSEKYIKLFSYSQNFNKIRGDIFELICKYLFIKLNYKQVYLYNECPISIKDNLNLPYNDKGIDLILYNNNKWIGVQCKWRFQQNYSIKKCYVAEFLDSINQSKLDYGILFTNVYNITPGFDNRNNLKWFVHNYLDENIDNLFVQFVNNDINNIKFNNYENIEPIKLRYYQDDAVDTLNNNNETRKQIILPCGTGKTYIIFKYLEDKLNKKILFLLPSLNLISQTYHNFNKLYPNLNLLAICSQLDSDNLTNGESNKIKSENIYNEFLANDYNKLFTTNTDIINKKLKSNSIIVFSTYHSSYLLIKHNFDIGIFDEAHKTVNNKQFNIALYDNNINISNRIFLTATPRYYRGKSEICESMDSVELYGKQIFNYSFKQAIEDNYILDYQIIFYTIPSEYENIIIDKWIKFDNIPFTCNNIKSDKVEKNMVISAIQLAKHIQNYNNSKHILTYHNTVQKAKSFSKLLYYIFNKFNINANIFNMCGTDSISKRKRIINEFSESEISIICSARVLNEGIDIPCVDTILFVDSRKSTIDITQCIGRAMRLYKNQQICNIILPIYYNNINNNYEFQHIIEILSTLSEIDDNIIEWFINKNKSNKIQIRQINDLHNTIVDNNLNINEINYNVNDIINDVKNKMIKSKVLGMNYKINLLLEFVEKNNRVPQRREKYKNINIGGFYQDRKKIIKSDKDELYIKLSKDEIIKENLDQLFINREKNKKKLKLSQDEKISLLFDFVEINNRVPQRREKYKNINIGGFYQNRKKIIKSDKDELYIKLSKNEILKENLDQLFIYRENNKNNLSLKLNQDEKINLLLEFVEINNRTPQCKEKYKNINIGNFYFHLKGKIKSKEDELYLKLSENKILKENLDQLFIYREKNKNNLSLKLNKDEKINLLFEFVEINNRTPQCKEKYEKINIGIFYANLKRKIKSRDCELYIKLSKSEILKENLDKKLAKLNGVDN